MKDRDQAEAIATERMQLIAPLLGDYVDAALARQLKATISAQSGLSERTIRRYVARYQEEGFRGLLPAHHASDHPSGAIAPDILDQAIQLRREAPHRSVRQIIQVLEWEGRVAPGQVKRSTLQDQLTARGYSTRQMRIYTQAGVAARRFQRRHRNDLWQSDLKYGPRLPIGPDHQPQQIYLSAIIDDATRYVVHAAWYPTQDAVIVEDSLRAAMRRYGIPARLYFDNGKQYRSHQMARMGAKLGIRIVYTKPYAPESKGKIERFNRIVDSFLEEVRLDKPTTLEQFNERFQVWLEECYQTQPHSALPDHRHPEAAFRSDTEPLRFVDIETLTAAFQRVDIRKVDKAGCISFGNRKYEVGIVWVGKTVDVIYDPADVSELTIEVANHAPWTARPLEIGEYAGHRPLLPDHLGEIPVTESRVLAAAAKQRAARHPVNPPAISFRGLSSRKEEPDV